MMYCFQCGAQLDVSRYCPECGSDVHLYKKALAISNRYYNDGLEKAQVRDLSGAVSSLRQSIKFNKSNTNARNLLGLVYFELGEVVWALGEWVISKNLQAERNPADRYLHLMKTNPGRLENMNQAVKKYNQGLNYCRQGSLDLAVIQLKKVLSINPKFVKAHQLLALLYLHAQSWGKAKAQLNKCLKIDKGSTITQRYLREADRMMLPEERRAAAADKKEGVDAVREKHGNETIIRPVHRFKPTSGFNISGLLVGLIVGVAFAVFLILPARIREVTNERKQELTTISEESDAKSAKLLEYEAQIETLINEREALEEELNAQALSDEKAAGDALMEAVNLYLTDAGDMEAIALALEPVSEEVVEESSPDVQALYETFCAFVAQPLSQRYYTSGYAAYRSQDFAAAAEDFVKCCQYDKENADAWYYLAMSYYRDEQIEEAKVAFNEVIERFPRSERAQEAQTSLAEINSANG